MNPFKSLFRLFSTKTNSLVVSKISALDNYNMAATKLIDNIERLSHQKNANALAVSEFESKAKTLNDESNDREAQVKALIAKGSSVDKTVVAIILRKRQLAAGLQAKADTLKVANTKINEGIVRHGDTLDNLKAQLELARLEETFKKEGIALPDSVDFDMAEVETDVDRLLMEVDVFTDTVAESAVTSLDIDTYLESLKA